MLMSNNVFSQDTLRISDILKKSKQKKQKYENGKLMELPIFLLMGQQNL